METGVTETRTVGGGAERSNRRMARVTQLDSQECRANDYHVVRNGNYDKTLAAQEEVASFMRASHFQCRRKSPEFGQRLFIYIDRQAGLGCISFARPSQRNIPRA